jgi:hypothetical protein
MTVLTHAGALTFSVPRLGCLTSGTPPRALKLIVPSEP